MSDTLGDGHHCPGCLPSTHCAACGQPAAAHLYYKRTHIHCKRAHLDRKHDCVRVQDHSDRSQL
jgi:hypothetical protein